jgi:hypothetical protein
VSSYPLEPPGCKTSLSQVGRLFRTQAYLEAVGAAPVAADFTAAVDRLATSYAPRAGWWGGGEGVVAQEQAAADLRCVAEVLQPMPLGRRWAKRKFDEKWSADGAGSDRRTPLRGLGDLALPDSSAAAWFRAATARLGALFMRPGGGDGQKVSITWLARIVRPGPRFG